jgi:hypothetical protein
MPSLGSFEQLCDNILELNSNIRFVGIINGMGDLVAGGMREGVQSMEDRENSSKLYSFSTFKKSFTYGIYGEKRVKP